MNERIRRAAPYGKGFLAAGAVGALGAQSMVSFMAGLTPGQEFFYHFVTLVSAVAVVAGMVLVPVEAWLLLSGRDDR